MRRYNVRILFCYVYNGLRKARPYLRKNKDAGMRLFINLDIIFYIVHDVFAALGM